MTLPPSPAPPSVVVRCLSWLAQGALILLAAALMWAILLPVRHGVSDDSRRYDPQGFPVDGKPKPPPKR